MKFILYYKMLFLSMLVFVFTSCAAQVSKEKNINIIFRFDDPSALSSTETELKVIAAFKKHNASVTFGVIPFKCKNTRDTSPQDLSPLGVKKGKLLRKASEEGIVDIALHGYSHQMRKAKIWTEFFGMDYASQLDKIAKGKKLIKDMTGKTVSIFIPPYNTYDTNTLKALEELNFSTLSAGIRVGSTDSSKLNFIPMTIRLHQIHNAVMKARASSDKSPLIVVMFHEYDFMKTKIKGIENRAITFEELNTHLAWIKSQKDIRILSLTQANKLIKGLNAKRLQLINRYAIVKSMIPNFFTKTLSVYPEYSSLLDVLIKTIFMYLFFLIFSIIVCYIILCLILRRYPNISRFIVFGNTILTIAFIVYVTHDLVVHFKGMTIIAILLGSSFASWICLINNKKTNIKYKGA